MEHLNCNISSDTNIHVSNHFTRQGHKNLLPNSKSGLELPMKKQITLAFKA